MTARVIDLRERFFAEPCRVCGHRQDAHLGFTDDQNPLTMSLAELIEEATPGPCRVCWRAGRRCLGGVIVSEGDDVVLTLAPEHAPATVTPLSPATRRRQGDTP